METLSSEFRDIIKQVVLTAKSSTAITDKNVYQPGDADILPLIDQIIEALLLPGSGISGMEHIIDLYEKAVSGKSCLLLVEHYSNMDLPILSYLLRKEPGPGKKIADSLIAIAGMKLNEENPTVAAFTGAYTRLVIYPSRSLRHLDPEKDRAEKLRSISINRAAMKALASVKTQGRIILVFPSGTRYRPWDPSTKRGVREIDSYIKSFNYFCPVAMNGEVLHVRQGDMMDDYVSRDLLRITVGSIHSCREFREATRSKAEAAGFPDKKQITVDTIMEMLEEMHLAAEEDRKALLG
ncbi:MAG: 1-acyl-sn-glycerol-3-phosphate acyltransferase [Spirochaetaceae bacterium]|jgi:glycerol-3-phosphate O-acyltransferase|nr:1-acyl-sn-glycerol-3-phosphate acyltransferase [Spirochaetaceae bacterium]